LSGFTSFLKMEDDHTCCHGKWPKPPPAGRPLVSDRAATLLVACAALSCSWYQGLAITDGAIATTIAIMGVLVFSGKIQTLASAVFNFIATITLCVALVVSIVWAVGIEQTSLFRFIHPRMIFNTIRVFIPDTNDDEARDF